MHTNSSDFENNNSAIANWASNPDWESALAGNSRGAKPNTLAALLNAAPAASTAIVVPELGIKVTYDSLRQQVMAMAEALAAAGIRRGDRVATALPNGLPAIVAFLAASIAGTAAPLNPAYPYEEFLFFLQDTNARVLLCPPTGHEEARSAAADRRIPVFSVEMKSDGTVHLSDAPHGGALSEPSPDDIALILHTSGSTGRPKRVPLRHANLALSAANIAGTYQLSPEDVSLCIMPLFHIHGIVGSTLSTLSSGGTVVAPTKFKPLAFWRTVREYRVTWYSGVPTMHQLLLARTRQEKPAEAATLRFIRSCSAPLPIEVIQKMEEVFRVPFVEAYGMTEAAHQMSANPLPPSVCKHGSVGLPTGIRISIMDSDGNHQPTNERGEVVIQGPTVFSGYENNGEANGTSFVDGWFRTGDQGFLDDDGYLHLTGRIKDLIIRGGENIAPREIDEILLKHPAIAEAVTFGYEHPTLGEEVAAAVVLHQPEGITESELLKHCRDRVAEFKCPKKIYIVENIPTTATGKIRRRAVAAALLDEQE
ncbi:MAG TPA: acyl--CoA ligase [Terriglobales bacterium]|nr:acyl--CoA ligase [Terriglobales bacterium]